MTNLVFNATVAPVKIGFRKIEGLKFDDGNFGVAVSQFCELFQLPKDNGSRIVKDLLGDTFKLPKAITNLNSKYVNVLKLCDFSTASLELAFQGNDIAKQFSREIQGVSLEQLFSDAFGVEFDKEDRQDFLKDMQSIKDIAEKNDLPENDLFAGLALYKLIDTENGQSSITDIGRRYSILKPGIENSTDPNDFLWDLGIDSLALINMVENSDSEQETIDNVYIHKVKINKVLLAVRGYATEEKFEFLSHLVNSNNLKEVEYKSLRLKRVISYLFFARNEITRHRWSKIRSLARCSTGLPSGSQFKRLVDKRKLLNDNDVIAIFNVTRFFKDRYPYSFPDASQDVLDEYRKWSRSSRPTTIEVFHKKGNIKKWISELNDICPWFSEKAKQIPGIKNITIGYGSLIELLKRTFLDGYVPTPSYFIKMGFSKPKSNQYSLDDYIKIRDKIVESKSGKQSLIYRNFASSGIKKTIE